MREFIVWWLVLAILGAITLPITLKLLRFLPDRGVTLARPVGLILSGYLFWLLAVLGVLPNSTAAIVLVLAALAAVSGVIWAREGRALWAALCERRRLIAIAEALFLCALAALALLRAYSPDIAATEKPMEFAFINSILRSPSLPPQDPWLAGYGISYYYFGYVMAAMVTRLSALPSDVTFNLLGATLFALTVVGTFGLVYNLAQAYLERRNEQAPAARPGRGAARAGLFGAILVAVMGNLEGLFELIRARGLGPTALWNWLDVRNLAGGAASGTWYPTDPWWWWRASRIIHDRDLLGQSQEVISEFPFFSFLLGDNHPHVLALPFVLLALALSFNLLLSRRGGRPAGATGSGEGGVLDVGTGAQGGAWELALWAVMVGALGFLNTWDYPIYLTLFVAAYAVRRQFDRGLGGDWLRDVLAFGVTMLGLGIAAYAPFYLGLRSQAGGLGLVQAKTQLQQYLLMFAPLIWPLAGFLAALAGRALRGREGRLPAAAWITGGGLLAASAAVAARGWWTAALALALGGGAMALWLWASWHPRPGGHDLPLEESTSFALLLALGGLLLTAGVEFVMLKDSFGTRMNTVFKFYYQGWVLLGIAAAYGVFYLWQTYRGARLAAKISRLAWGAGTLALVAAGLSYTVAAVPARAEGFRGEPTLDGTRYVRTYRSDVYGAVQWLRANAPAGAVLLEAPGNSYTEANWVSAHTGIPTLLGWTGHELQWRGNYDEPGRREPDIAAIYQGTDAGRALALLEAYGVDYVYVGPDERYKYGLTAPMIDKFDAIMARVYESGEVILFAFPSSAAQ